MAAVDSLRTHLVEELTDLRSAEEQLIEALPKMAKSATAKTLRIAFQKHLGETRTHVTRLNQALRALGEKPESKTCKGMQGLLKEGNSVMGKTPEGALRDAVMITSAQKVEHYEMASYGTARTYAQVLGESDVARLLEQTLREEKAADVTLTRIAEGEVNEEAADEWQSQTESMMEIGSEWVNSASRGVTRTMKRAMASAGLASERSGGRRTAARKTRRSASKKR
jgi:ferritin-like metal-binding protein YciE